MTSCIRPDEIPDWRWEAYLDGERTPDLERHLMECSYCTARLTQLSGLSDQLKAALHRVDCPSADALRAYRWHELPAERAGVIAEHLLECRTCRRELAVFAGPALAPALGQDNAERPLLTQVHLFIARLVTTAQPAAPALRGTLIAGAVYQVTETDWEVTLRETIEARGYAVAGQVLGPEPEALEAGRVTALADGQPALAASLDASGWFTLRGLAPGRYALWIEIAEDVIHLPTIEIGAPLPTI